MSNPRSLVLSAFFGVFLTVAGASPVAQAREFRHYPEPAWRGGHWVHDRHGGRLGWWWVVGPNWIFYPHPHSFVIQAAPPQTVYMQQPPITVIQQAPPIAVSPVLYYCKATGTHYPETMSCPGGWSTMTAETPPQPMATQ